MLPPDGWKPDDDGPRKPRPSGPKIRPKSKRDRVDRVERIKAQIDEMQGKLRVE
jgi:hypothetical protein